VQGDELLRLWLDVKTIRGPRDMTDSMSQHRFFAIREFLDSNRDEPSLEPLRKLMDNAEEWAQPLDIIPWVHRPREGPAALQIPPQSHIPNPVDHQHFQPIATTPNSTAHTKANPSKDAQAYWDYKAALQEWEKLPWWKRIGKKPEQPLGSG
jgi:hypothetical protein